METFITISSTNIFESVNPFWAAMDRRWMSPSSCIVLHVPEHKKKFQKINRWFDEISLEYQGAKSLTVEPRLFDDENIPGFITTIKEIIRKESQSGNSVIANVTSAEWNYIPASLMLMAEENRKVFKHVLYQQFSSPENARTPYPLIPLTEQKLYNFLEITALEELSL